MQNNKLLIFSRSPILGSVKTRLAREVGNSKALEIHNKLFNYTNRITSTKSFARGFYLTEDISIPPIGDYKLQRGDNLGERMLNAFDDELEKYQKVCLIGIDCPTLSTNDIINAFAKLATYDVVLGPASDGGYYLIGMKRMYHQLFTNISWGKSTVMAETMQVCKAGNLTVYQLQVQNDVDNITDVPDGWL